MRIPTANLFSQSHPIELTPLALLTILAGFPVVLHMNPIHGGLVGYSVAVIGYLLFVLYLNMNRPVPTLIRLQLRIMMWPIVALIILLLIPVFLSVPSTFISHSLITACMWFAGAYIFGVEYIEGARDYLRTRPVSPTKVLICKLIVLILYVTLGSLPLLGIPFPAGLSTTEVTTARYLFIDLSAALLSAAFAVVFRDMVRGLLVSIALFAGIVLIGSQIDEFYLQSFFGNQVILFPSGYTESFNDPLFELAGPLLMMCIPFVFLAIFITIYYSVIWQRLYVPLPALILIIFVLVMVGSFFYCYSPDGKLSVQSLPAINRNWYINDRKLLWVEPGMHRLHIKSLNLDSPKAEPSNAIICPGTIEGSPADYYLSSDLMIAATRKPDVTGTDTIPWKLYCYRLVNNTSAVLAHEIPLSSYPKAIREESWVFGASSGTWKELSLSTGEIADLVEPPSKELMHDIRCNCDYGCETGYERAACDGDLKAIWGGFFDPVWNGHLDDRPFGDKKIQVINVNEQDKKICVLPLPLRYLWMVNHLRPLIENLGYRFYQLGTTGQYINYHFYSCMTLDKGYLCYWDTLANRVIIWRNVDTQNAELVGILPVPILNEESFVGEMRMGNATMPNRGTPVHRADGALGFVIPNVGIWWLEFPALMKEAKS